MSLMAVCNIVYLCIYTNGFYKEQQEGIYNYIHVFFNKHYIKRAIVACVLITLPKIAVLCKPNIDLMKRYYLN